MGPRERVWGYTGASGMVQGFAAGYFLWDLAICAGSVDVHGPGALLHAASALAVSLLGFVSAGGVGRCEARDCKLTTASGPSATITA